MATSSENRLMGSKLRVGLVLLAWSVVTLSYFAFSHYVHKPNRFETGSSSHHPSHHHEPIRKDWILLYGLALPMLGLALTSLVWNPSTNMEGKTTNYASINKDENKLGDVNVQKWTMIFFLVPLLLIMLEGAIAHRVFRPTGEEHMEWNLYVRVCMSLMSPSGYAATWALALFLIPVTKHSPILDWLRVTPVQALAFHRVAGWTSFWNSVLHGFLHLRHLMDVLNPQRLRSWNEQLKILLIPSSWKCYTTENPFGVFVGHQDPLSDQCWLALVNLTGMISVLAFVVLAITSLPSVRRYSYALFYRVHIPSAWIMLIMAIWHYPACALILIPNIIYYLSFQIPVFVEQNSKIWKTWTRLFSTTKKNLIASPLVEANLIQGGSIELVFATTSTNIHRHESHFVRLSCPLASPLYHPFSIFSRNRLLSSTSGNDLSGTQSRPETFSILLRPSGPFTEKLTKILFESVVDREQISQEQSNDETQEFLASISRPLLPPNLPCQILVDSFYAGSFDWVNRSMRAHDEILIAAGGVGIAPFLEFLPSLSERIRNDTFYNESTNDLSLDSEANMESVPNNGPSKIHLHWFCRDVGLVSFVWKNFLEHHIDEVWENEVSCQGRLKIHIHLTSLDPDEAGEDILESISSRGLQQSQKYFPSMQNGSECAVQDARFAQSMWLSLLVPGVIVLAGIVIHWWWYIQYILSVKFRHDNLLVRAYSVGFSFVVAMIVSALAEVYHEYHDRKVQDSQEVVEDSSAAELSLSQDTESSRHNTRGLHSENQMDTDPFAVDLPDCSKIRNHVKFYVTGGRPPIENVISDIADSERPGVFSCGPRPLMESVEDEARSRHEGCGFYREDSEM